MKRRSFFKSFLILIYLLKSKVYGNIDVVYNEKKAKSHSSNIAHKKNICFIGIGGGGTNILADIAKNNPKNIFIHINSDKQSLALKKRGSKILLDNSNVGLGCGGDIECGKKSVTSKTKARLDFLTKHATKIYVISTLGGGVSSGATPEIIKYLQYDLKKDVVVFSVMPFNFEGAKRLKIANDSKNAISMYTDQHFILHNDSLLKKRFSQGIQSGFASMSRQIYNKINSIENEKI